MIIPFDSAVTGGVDHLRLCQVIDGYAEELFEVTRLGPVNDAERARRAQQAETAAQARAAIAFLQRCCRQSKSKLNQMRCSLLLRQIRGTLLAPDTGLLTHDAPRPRAVGKPATRQWRRKHLPKLFARVKAAGHDTEAALTLIAHHFSLVWSACDANLPLRAFRQLWGPTIRRSTPVEERAETLRAQLRRQLWPRATTSIPAQSSFRP